MQQKTRCKGIGFFVLIREERMKENYLICLVWDYLISRRLAAGTSGVFSGMVRVRTPSLYSAVMASVSIPLMLKLRLNEP